MLRLFHAGLVAAARQLLAVIAVTLSIILLSRHGLLGPFKATGMKVGHVLVSPLLSWSYLLTAANSALTNRQVADSTAARIRDASRRMCPTTPHQVIKKLMVHLWLAAAGLAVLTLLPAPAILVVATGHLGCEATAAVGWPALMSIGVAYFGANARAAQRAL